MGKGRTKRKGGRTVTVSIRPRFSDEQVSVMRQLRSESDRLLSEAQRLGPRTGFVSVGGAHVDPLARGLGIEAFLAELGQSGSSTKALEAAKREAALAFEKWNQRAGRDFVVKRSTSGADAYLEAQRARYDRAGR